MSEVIDLSRRRPHSAGRARCVDCGKIWEAVAPIGVTRLECPDCGTMRGAWMGLHTPPDGSAYWQCTCGNDLFTLTAVGAPMCARCGLRANGWAES